MRRKIIGICWLMPLIVGCNSSSSSFASLVDGLHAKNSPLRSGLSSSHRFVDKAGAGAGFAGAQYLGTGSFVSTVATAEAVATASETEGEFELNLVNAPIEQAARAVLGDALGASYIIDPRVQGTITLQTSGPVSREVLSEILDTALALNGAGVVQRSGVYRILPMSEILSATPAVSTLARGPSGPGVNIHVVELQYISADEMKTLLEPIARQGSILRVDPRRNLMMLAGTSTDLATMREAISVFDVDWMKGMSVAIHPLKTSSPEAVVRELETIFGSDAPGQKLIRFVPNERLNSVLVITSRPAYLTRAASWIAKLDVLAQGAEQQLFVYKIQNRPANELAAVLGKILKGGATSGGADSAGSVAPDATPVFVSADGQSDASMAERMGAEPANTDGRLPAVSVTADVENNALLIQAPGREFERIEGILKQLDVMPTQVLIEAVIAEVTRDDELKFGLRWFFENGNMSLGLSDVVSGFVGSAFPGFSWSYATRDIHVTLNALSSVTDVNVVSAPSLMALNNQKATLQVGDQVPIVTQQVTGTGTANAPVVNAVEMKDTGVILDAIPHVNSSGRIMLDIEQEVSSVSKTTSSGIDSPTIQRRRIATRILVNDGESLALGGLIQERNGITRGQVPILGDLPIVGNAFKNKTDGIKRTELII